MKKIKYSVLTCLFFISIMGISQAQIEKNKLILGLSYFNDNNRLQYLKVNTKAKINGKFKQVSGIPVSFYIGSENAANFLGRCTTDNHGLAALPIPAAARDTWNKSPSKTFLVVSDSTQLYSAVTTSFDLTKARIKLDTAEDKKIVATLFEQKGSDWLPVKGVDLKIAVKRLDGNLNVNESPIFTTDSTGAVNTDFKLLNLPGDSAGNLVLIASVEDNDIYGNITTEKTVPWGTPTKYISNYDNRSLFARAGRPPLWLLWLASTITLSVWSIIFYLFFQIWKLKKLGV